MNTPDAVVSSISPEAWKRIEGGLLEIEALWHTCPHRGESAYVTGKRYLCLAYDVFARELLPIEKISTLDKLYMSVMKALDHLADQVGLRVAA